MNRSALQATLMATLTVLALSACSNGDTATAVVERVDVQAAADLIAERDVVILDIRTPEEFDTGHIEGSINIDFRAADFASNIDQLDRDVEYVMYCRTGNRSGQAMGLFTEYEFTSVHEIGEGIVGWNAAGLPIVGG